jgi:hypothetical protein
MSSLIISRNFSNITFPIPISQWRRGDTGIPTVRERGGEGYTTTNQI